MLEKFISYFLVVVLILLPFQVSLAAVSSCHDMESMKHEMTFSKMKAVESNTSGNKSFLECCKKNKCASSQCAVPVIALLPKVHAFYKELNKEKIVIINNDVLLNYPLTSIYRPPKS